MKYKYFISYSIRNEFTINGTLCTPTSISHYQVLREHPITDLTDISEIADQIKEKFLKECPDAKHISVGIISWQRFESPE